MYYFWYILIYQLQYGDQGVYKKNLNCQEGRMLDPYLKSWGEINLYSTRNGFRAAVLQIYRSASILSRTSAALSVSFCLIATVFGLFLYNEPLIYCIFLLLTAASAGSAAYLFGKQLVVKKADPSLEATRAQFLKNTRLNREQLIFLRDESTREVDQLMTAQNGFSTKAFELLVGLALLPILSLAMEHLLANNTAMFRLFLSVAALAIACYLLITSIIYGYDLFLRRLHSLDCLTRFRNDLNILILHFDEYHMQAEALEADSATSDDLAPLCADHVTLCQPQGITAGDEAERPYTGS